MIFMVSGSKGGVGKSIVSIAMIDYLQQLDRRVMVIETDSSNPDVYKAYENEKDILLDVCNLDEQEGWFKLIDIIESNMDYDIVINTASRNMDAIRKYNALFVTSLKRLGVVVHVIWVINRQRDSIELLRQYRKLNNNDNVAGEIVIYVIRNLYFGNENRFELYNKSNLMKEINDSGGDTLNFPDLADRITDKMNSERLSIAQALQILPTSSWAELSRWREAVKDVMKNIIKQ